VIDDEGLEACAAGDHQLRKEIDPGDLYVEPGSRQLALGLTDIGSVLKQLRGQSYAQRVDLQIVESLGHAFDTLRVAIDEEVDAVFALDDRLIDDELFALIPFNIGLETPDGQLGVAAGFLPGLGDLEALLLKRDDLIQVLKPFVEAHEPVKILGNVCDQGGHEVVPPLSSGDVALPCRVSGIPQLPIMSSCQERLMPPPKFPWAREKNFPGDTDRRLRRIHQA